MWRAPYLYASAAGICARSTESNGAATDTVVLFYDDLRGVREARRDGGEERGRKCMGCLRQQAILKPEP